MLTDEELAVKVQTGDRHAVTIAYERYRTGLFKFCARMLSDGAAAEDVVQDTFLALITKKEQLRDPSVLRSWMYTVARNECLTMLKKRRTIQPITEDEEESVFEGPVMTLEMKERTKVTEQMLNALLPQYKEVILLKEYEYMSYEEIADVTGTTISSVKSRLFKARRSMMKIMQHYTKEDL